MIPPAGIGVRIPTLPDWHGARAQGLRPLPRSREVVTPGFPANLKAGRVLVWMMFGVLCFPMSGGWQGARLLMFERGLKRIKRVREVMSTLMCQLSAPFYECISILFQPTRGQITSGKSRIS